MKIILDNLSYYKFEQVTHIRGEINGYVDFYQYCNIGIVAFREITCDPRDHDGNGNIICNNPSWFRPRHNISTVAYGGNLPIEVTLTGEKIYGFSYNKTVEGLSACMCCVLEE